jgi:energy-coupling factor transport system substrate-specific component
MRDVVDMWGNTRMVVLTAMSASLYAAILIPFKVLPIIPGVTEFRPANAVPVICSFLFGPAGAWGAAIGNVIGDFFGGIGPGDFFGFFGNFLYGLVPYRLWHAIMGERDPVPHTVLQWGILFAVIACASAACALVIGWGLNLLGFLPFSLLGNIIFVNNSIVSAVLTPFLLAVIYPRVKKAQLRYGDILGRARRRAPLIRIVGVALVIIALAGGMLGGNLLSTGRIELPFLAPAAENTTRAGAVGLGLIPVLVVLLIGLALL